jgi:hypothetical protein
MPKKPMLTTILAILIVASACSTGASDQQVASIDTEVTQAPDTATGLVPGEDSVLAFTSCLRDEGLDVDDPAVDGEGNLVAPTPHAVAARTLDMAAVHSAFDVCRGLLDGLAFGLSTEELSEREDELLKFAVCMRENGYDMPDPDFSDGGHDGEGPFGDAVDTGDPAFRAAAKSCEGIVGAGS